MKYRRVIYAVCVILIVSLSLLFFHSHTATRSTTTATINHHTFFVTQAITPQEQTKGLGNRVSLPQDQGMLFLFPKPDKLYFWMKDMEFPIDIIFIRDHTIISVAENAPALHVPDNELPLYASAKPSDKVLEINAGLFKKYHFRIGDRLTISSQNAAPFSQ